MATPNIDDFLFTGAVSANKLPVDCFFFFPNKDRLPRDSALVSETAAVDVAALAATLLAAALAAATLSSSGLLTRVWGAGPAGRFDKIVLSFETGDLRAVGEVALVEARGWGALSRREIELELAIRCIALSFLL